MCEVCVRIEDTGSGLDCRVLMLVDEAATDAERQGAAGLSEDVKRLLQNAERRTRRKAEVWDAN